MTLFSRILLSFFAIAIPLNSLATTYHGRVSLGGYLSRERFDDADESQTNDRNFYAGRFFLDLTKVGSTNFGATVDVRDKYDLFSQVNKEEATLEEKNTFQARQLALKYATEGQGFQTKLGRFPAMDGGISYVDGGEISAKVFEPLSLGIFAGYDPTRQGYYELNFNADHQIYGFFTTYRTAGFKLAQHLYSQTAIIGTQEKSDPVENPADPTVATETNEDLKTSYIYNSNTIQFPKTYLSTVLYYDLEPVKSLRHFWGSIYSNLFSIMRISLYYSQVNYLDRQINLLVDPLEINTKVEAYGLNLKFRVFNKNNLGIKAEQGKRYYDDKKKSNYMLYYDTQKFFSNKVGASLYVGARERYTYKENYTGLTLGYFSDNFELLLVEEMAKRTPEEGETLNRLDSELSFSHFWSKTLFSSLALQYIADEQTSIASALLRIGYRFGNREIPPIRDGAPPSGRI